MINLKNKVDLWNGEETSVHKPRFMIVNYAKSKYKTICLVEKGMFWSLGGADLKEVQIGCIFCMKDKVGTCTVSIIN
jgi:leucyl aminopeptidase